MRTPKLSLGSWAFSFGPFSKDPWSFSSVLQYTAEAGYDGIEINGFRPHPHPDDYDSATKCQQLVDEIKSYELGISGYAPALNETPPSSVDSAVYLKNFQNSLAFCNRFEINMMRIDSVDPPTPMATKEYEARFAQITSTWRLAAEEAAKEGVLIVWEFEPGFWLNKPSEVSRVVEAVGHDNFKVLFDTCHAYMGAIVGANQMGKKEVLKGGIVEYGQLLGENIGHLHLIDSDGSLHDDETSTHSAFGEGKIDFSSTLTKIKPWIEHLPWWCIDFCFNPHALEGARDAVKIVKQLMKEVLIESD